MFVKRKSDPTADRSVAVALVVSRRSAHAPLDSYVARNAAGGFGQCLVDRRRVALVSALHRDTDDRAGVQVNGVLGLVGQMRPAIIHLGDLGVGIVRMGPVLIRPLLLA